MPRGVNDPDLQPVQVKRLVAVKQNVGAVFPFHPDEEKFTVLSVDHLLFVPVHEDFRVFKQGHGPGMIAVGVREQEGRHLFRFDIQLGKLFLHRPFIHPGIDHQVSRLPFKDKGIHKHIFDTECRLVDP